MAHACVMCGWVDDARNGDGRCIDQAPCAHRVALNRAGRPRASRCRCAQWPCLCSCHGDAPHEAPHDPTFDPLDDNGPPTRPSGLRRKAS